MKNVLLKIKGVGLCKLLFIVLLRVLRTIVDFLYRWFGTFAWNNSYKCKANIEINELCILYEQFLSKYNSIKQSNDIMNGDFIVFGKKISYHSSFWLNDPFSGKDWDRYTYYKNCFVENVGYGDVKYILELNKLGSLVILAHSYKISKDEKYLKSIYSYLLDWKKTIILGHGVINKSMLDIVYRCVNLIHISILSYESKYFRDIIFLRF